MEYLTVQETAEKWNLSDRMVQQFCTQGRIPGAQKFGRSWAIPADAEKPEDPRRAEKQAAPRLQLTQTFAKGVSLFSNVSTFLSCRMAQITIE